MDKKTALAILLSDEELFVIMAYLGAKTLLGVDNTSIKDLSDDHYKLAMRVAERSLIAREFLLADGKGKFKLSDIPHALVGACAAPDSSLIIQRNRPEKVSEEFLFHFSRKMIVMHIRPMTAIHQFIALANKDAMLKSGLSILELGTDRRLDCPPAQLDEDALAQIRELIQKKDLESAKRILLDANWKETTIEAYLTSLQKPIFSEAIMYIMHTPDGDGKVAGFTVFKAENGLWMLDAEKKRVSIRTASEDDVVIRLKGFINHLSI